MHVQGQNRPRQTPRCEARAGATFEPIETPGNSLALCFTAKRQQGNCSRVSVRPQSNAVDHAITRIPSSVQAHAIDQDLDTADDAEVGFRGQAAYNTLPQSQNRE